MNGFDIAYGFCPASECGDFAERTNYYFAALECDARREDAYYTGHARTPEVVYMQDALYLETAWRTYLYHVNAGTG